MPPWPMESVNCVRVEVGLGMGSAAVVKPHLLVAHVMLSQAVPDLISGFGAAAARITPLNLSAIGHDAAPRIPSTCHTCVVCASQMSRCKPKHQGFSAV